jgi:hypothetical protein
MSSWKSIEVETNLRFCEADVRIVLETLKQAVAENWENPELRDEWIDAKPIYPIEPEVWAARPRYQQPQSDLNWGGLEVNVFEWSFSPSSSYVCSIVLGQDDATNQLSLLLSVSEQAIYERVGQREMERMETEWRTIRRQRGEPDPPKTGPDESHPDYWPWWDKYERLQGSERAWLKNRKALLHLVEKLQETIPVQHVHIDDRLQSTEVPK